MSLEIYLIAALAVMLMGMYIVGDRWNYRIQKRVWRVLSKEIRPYCKSVVFKGLGASGFKVACRPRAGSLRKLEVSVILLAREMPLYYLISKYRGKHDSIVIKSNFKRAPNFSLEVIRKGGRFDKEMMKQPELKGFKRSDLLESFRIRASKSRPAAKILSSKAIIGDLTRLDGHVERLSIRSEESHLLVACAMKEDLIQPLLSLASRCGEAVESVMK